MLERWNAYNRVPIIYKHLHIKLKGKYFQGSNEISRQDINIFLSNHTIPKNFHNIVLKEMEHYGFLKIISKRNIRILF